MGVEPNINCAIIGNGEVVGSHGNIFRFRTCGQLLQQNYTARLLVLLRNIFENFVHHHNHLEELMITKNFIGKRSGYQRRLRIPNVDSKLKKSHQGDELLWMISSKRRKRGGGRRGGERDDLSFTRFNSSLSVKR
jgi:hypothetical protein